MDADAVRQARAATPGCHRVVHFNNAGAALPTLAVLDAQKDYLAAEAMLGGYETAAARSADLQRPYDALALMLNCKPRNIAIVNSASSAWMQVFYGIPFAPGDRILTSVAEYASNFIAFLQVARRTGASVEVIPEDGAGDIDFSALEELCRKPRTALIAITHAPTNSGRVYDAAAVGAIAAQYGIPYLLDACQSAGQCPLDVVSLQCWWLSGTGRKYLRGPRGTGFLFASDQAMERFEPATLDLHGATWAEGDVYTLAPSARRYEQYERNFAGQVGLGIAVEYGNALGWDRIWARIRRLAEQLRTGLRAVPGVTVGWKAVEVKRELAAHSISVHTSPLVFTRTDFERSGLPEEVVRASVHYYNTEDEVAQAVNAVQGLLTQRAPDA